ncbi:MAG: Peptidase C11 clostripain [candidate division TM6 bacterium GW2011_GWF2_37_49]|nr:MAG: Peptidase C11 clostripain [candidate division TM6 bacterium GW2011_GWF2_37_49]
MKINNFLCKLSIAICLFGQISAAKLETTKATIASTKASWTMLVYIVADNSLAPYALYNINDMSAGLASSNGINILVQWDKPNDNKTWRYKITPGGKIDAGTLSTEMGYTPSTELVNSMQWAVKNYPANNYALVLWNHGSGIEDFYRGVTKNILPQSKWLNLTPSSLERGILYDDTQGTCLTNQGLTSALTQIKQLLGKNLDLIATDACLMAMVEVTYQMKGLVNTFVGSQQTIPGNGYPYSKFIKPLSLNPAVTTTLQLAQSMVSSYKTYYTYQEPISDFTLSAIDVTSIDLIKQNIDQFIVAVAACSKIDAAKTKSIITAARKASISFEMPEYIDLYSFYANILNQTKKSSPKSALILEKLNKVKPRPKPRPKPTTAVTNVYYQNAITALNAIIQAGLTKIGQVVLKKAAGSVYAGAQGISIYYPNSGYIDPSYKKTIFAQNTAWTQFIQIYHS